MQIYCEGNISFEGKEYQNQNGTVEVPDHFPLDHMEAHGISTEPTKTKRGRPTKEVTE